MVTACCAILVLGPRHLRRVEDGAVEHVVQKHFVDIVIGSRRDGSSHSAERLVDGRKDSHATQPIKNRCELFHSDRLRERGQIGNLRHGGRDIRRWNEKPLDGLDQQCAQCGPIDRVVEKGVVAVREQNVDACR